jgi:DNA-directed RNA polymerase subunit RPC12/RpoP
MTEAVNVAQERECVGCGRLFVVRRVGEPFEPKIGVSVECPYCRAENDDILVGATPYRVERRRAEHEHLSDGGGEA